MRAAMVVLALGLSMLGPLCAQERVLYTAQWGQGGEPLDGWTVESEVQQARVDPELGAVLTLGSGEAVSPRLPVTGGHRARFRFTFAKTHGPISYEAILYGQVTQFRDGQRLLGPRQIWAQHPPIADPSPVELGVLLEPEAEEIELRFSVQGPADLRLVLSGLRVVDLGPLPAYQPDERELLRDPGWEGYAPRESLGPESSYFTGPGWMGWLRGATLAITRIPSRVRSGEHALMAQFTGAAGASGFRYLPSFPLQPDTWYGFSVWAKGEGALSLYYLLGGAYGDHYTMGSGELLASPDEWRRFHLVYCADNPAHSGFSVGILFRGRLFFDDLSLRQISPEEAAVLGEANARWPQPSQVPQTVPEGETRSAEPIALENEHLRVVLSPVGGGRVTELTDKQSGLSWTSLSALRLNFPAQPVPIEWNLPFATEKSADGQQVVFRHTATGGAAAPFLDGIAIEQIFRLRPGGRVLYATYRLTNTSPGTRLPNPVVSNSWSPEANVERVSASGEEGSLVAAGEAVRTRNLVDGWMAASRADSSLVWGFEVRAVQDGSLDPLGRSAEWSYLRPTLPTGGVWETQAWMATVALGGVAYADPGTVVQATVEQTRGEYALGLATAALAPTAPQVRARVVDYGGTLLARAEPGVAPARFASPSGRFITALDISDPEGRYSVELFNDPRGSQPEGGIVGAPQIQYRPTVPARVLRLPDVGDLRSQIVRSGTVLWAQGLYFQHYAFQPALDKAGLEAERLDWGAGFPEEVEELAAYRLVVLANLGAAHLTPSARAALSQYVRAGGPLLVLGGSLGLGNALTQGTDLEELLPAQLSGAFEVRPLQGEHRRLRPVRGSGLGSLPWPDNPALYWRHRIEPRPEAVPLILAGAEPVLLQWAYGRGQVLLFSGTVEGNPSPEELAVWDWAGWPLLWEEMLRRLLAASLPA